MDTLAQALSLSPELFPHMLDVRTNRMMFIRLAQSQYEMASFLDERILGPGTPRRSVPWPDVELALAEPSLSESCHYIFHVGHVGSTLLSRLIGLHRDAFSLREPGVLRTIAQIAGGPSQRPPWGIDGFERRLGGVLKLLSRTFEPGSKAIVKATSFVSEIAAEILARPSLPHALLMFVPAESYLATILGGANAPQEAHALGAMRLARLERRLGGRTPPISGIGERVAMSWACEMTALLNAKARAGDRALWLSFEALLAQPHSNFARSIRHFALTEYDEFIATALSGPDIRRYAKAPEHLYDAKLRHAVLNQARANHSDEIRRGVSWLDRLAKQYPIVQEAMNVAR